MQTKKRGERRKERLIFFFYLFFLAIGYRRHTTVVPATCRPPRQGAQAALRPRRDQPTLHRLPRHRRAPRGHGVRRTTSRSACGTRPCRPHRDGHEFVICLLSLRTYVHTSDLPVCKNLCTHASQRCLYLRLLLFFRSPSRQVVYDKQYIRTTIEPFLESNIIQGQGGDLFPSPPTSHFPHDILLVHGENKRVLYKS